MSCAVFFGSLAVASVFYFRNRPFDFKAAVISDLESPEDNPGGYGIAAAGTAVSAILLIPVTMLFHSRLRPLRRRAALLGAGFFAIGLAAAIAIGFLAPFTTDYTPIHINLAFTAFVGICAGSLVYSAIAAAPAFATGSRWGPRLAAMVVLQGSVLLFLGYLYFTPNFFNFKGLLTSLALWEWLLCANCVLSIWILIAGSSATPGAAEPPNPAVPPRSTRGWKARAMPWSRHRW
jgi:hypothetical protein